VVDSAPALLNSWRSIGQKRGENPKFEAEKFQKNANPINQRAANQRRAQVRAPGEGADDGRARVYALAGRKDEAQGVLEELRARAKRQYVPSTSLALVYLGLGQHERALEWLEKAVDERAVGVIYLKSDRRFDTLHNYPRFADLLRRIGLVE
jgi:predicted Zn-dependent protease